MMENHLELPLELGSSIEIEPCLSSNIQSEIKTYMEQIWNKAFFWNCTRLFSEF